MSPEPEPEPEQTMENFDHLEYFSKTWHDLAWSPWVPFDAPQDFWYIKKEPGLYRIRPKNKKFLMYIGETGQSLHKKLAELLQSLRRHDLMPWNDPYTAAPGLWAWQDAEGFEYECSAVPLDATHQSRRGMESYLLSVYRQEYGESTLCNFGRFHPRYRRSTNHKIGLRGGKLAEGQLNNPAGGPSLPPLKPTGTPGDANWMGLTWTAGNNLTADNIHTVTPGPGLFTLADATTHEILYIGQSEDCTKRLLDHSQKTCADHEIEFSYHILEQFVLPQNLKELQTDLIGNFFGHNRKVPEFQFQKNL